MGCVGLPMDCTRTCSVRCPIAAPKLGRLGGRSKVVAVKAGGGFGFVHQKKNELTPFPRHGRKDTHTSSFMLRSYTPGASPGDVSLDVAWIAIVVAGLLPWFIKLGQFELRPQKCATCLGCGSLVCERCEGRGKVGGVFEDDIAKCTLCNGCGRVPCLTCTGSGLKNSWLWKRSSNPGWGPAGNK